MPLTIREMKDGSDFAICMAIRMEVFVREQRVPLEREMDDHDQAATHYIATLEGQPMGTARTRVENHVGYLERIAVRQEFRRQGHGSALVQHLLQRLRNHPQVETISLSAPASTVAFYQRLGFVVDGAVYNEADIAHVRMRLYSLE